MNIEEFGEQFGPLLGAAQHQDKLRRCRWWQQLFHEWFVAWRCPACRYWNKKNGGRKNTSIIRARFYCWLWNVSKNVHDWLEDRRPAGGWK